MKEKKLKVEGSLTALSVMRSYIQSINTRLRNSPEFYTELCLSQHLISSAINFELNYPYGDENGVKEFLHYLQQMFFYKTVTPGYDSMILARKLMLKHKVETSILSKDVQQVIFLGGGYDIRAFISSKKFPNVQFYELDRGQTRQIKLKALGDIPKEVGIGQTLIDIKDNAHIFNNNFFCIECDFLTNNLEEVLKANGFKKGCKTLVVAEGLTMYLNKSGIRQLFTSLGNLLETHDELIVSFIPQIINSALSKEKHCFSLPPHDVISFVSEFGFNVMHKNLFSDLLVLMGDRKNAKIHENNPKLKQENYYILMKPSNSFRATDKTIYEVPDYKFETSLEHYEQS